jgi:hypothetical protein
MFQGALLKHVKIDQAFSTGYFAKPFTSWGRDSNEISMECCVNMRPKKSLNTVIKEEIALI